MVLKMPVLTCPRQLVDCKRRKAEAEFKEAHRTILPQPFVHLRQEVSCEGGSHVKPLVPRLAADAVPERPLENETISILIHR